MIGIMHMIKIGHLLKANLCIDQLKQMFNSSDNAIIIVADHVQQSCKYADAYLLHVLKMNSSNRKPTPVSHSISKIRSKILFGENVLMSTQCAVIT